MTKYLHNPRKADRIIANLCPVWEKLKVLCISQGTKYDSSDKNAELSFAWDSDEYAIEESGIDSFELLTLAKNEFLHSMDQMRDLGNQAFTKELGKKFRFCV